MKTVITTVVDKRYRDYTELFTWCAKKSYPEYDVLILDMDRDFKGYPDERFTTNALRMVTGYEPYQGYDNIYITDIDMMILPEIPRLHDFHLREMQRYKRCYSNSLRNRHHVFSCGDDKWNGYHCLSGLHFCNKEWFERTKESQIKWREYLKLNTVGRGFDGRILYLMAKENGLGLPGKHNLLKRHHGIHLGTFRLYDPRNPEINDMERKGNPCRNGRRSILKRIGIRKAEIWRRYLRDPEYQNIIGKIKNIKVLEIVKLLYEFVNTGMIR